jgi:hypothetical protein
VSQHFARSFGYRCNLIRRGAFRNFIFKIRLDRQLLNICIGMTIAEVGFDRL